MSVYQVNNHTLHVESCGPEDGPAVVLLHHGLGSVYSWKDTLPVLGDAGYFAIAYDRWGYGRSGPREELSMPFFYDDLDDLDDLLTILGRDCVSLIGHSDGGTIALYYAAKFPEKVASLVTVAAHVYVEPKMESGIEGVRRSFERDQRFREALSRLHGEKVDQVFQGWYKGWRKPENLNWDMRPALRRIECPALIVQGVDDEHATTKQAMDIASAIPNATAWLVHEANHMFPQERADEFNHRILTFLSEHVPAAECNKS
jgi:pimeloyl-ACP methyl ester carboxylesterase